MKLRPGLVSEQWTVFALQVLPLFVFCVLEKIRLRIRRSSEPGSEVELRGWREIFFP